MFVLLAGGTDKAARVVSLAQGGYNFPFNKLFATEAPGPIETLIIQSADILALSHEKASLSQVTTTNCREKQIEELQLHWQYTFI